MRIVTPTRKHVSILLTFCIYFHTVLVWDSIAISNLIIIIPCKFGMASQSQNLILKTKEYFKMSNHVMFFVQGMKEAGFYIRDALLFKL